MPSVEELKDPGEYRHTQRVLWRAAARFDYYTRIQGLLRSFNFRNTGFDCVSVTVLPDQNFRLETPSLIIVRKSDGSIRGHLSVTAKRK